MDSREFGSRAIGETYYIITYYIRYLHNYNFITLGGFMETGVQEKVDRLDSIMYSMFTFRDFRSTQ